MDLFGKGIIKVISLVVGGAIALAAGAQLLASVVSVVLSFRYGNFIPLAIVIVLTIIVLLIANRVPDESPTRVIIKILAYAITGYLAVVAFVISLPYGLIVSIIAAGAVGVFSSMLGEQKILWNQVKNLLPSSNRYKGFSRSVRVGDGTSFRLNFCHNIVVLSEGTREKLIHLMKERPLLPISLTHYEDCDVLFIDENRYERVMKLLKDLNIGIKGPASTLLSEAIQMIPILDSKNGLKFEDYRLARDDATINSLLAQAPLRLTVYPSATGLGVIIPDMEAPGLNVEPLKRGSEVEIILHRNYSILEEAEKSIESTA
jgi:hypothetical protein